MDQTVVMRYIVPAGVGIHALARGNLILTVINSCRLPYSHIYPMELDACNIEHTFLCLNYATE